MPRKLNNPDMPSLAYKYDIRIIGDVPQVIWDTGRAMNALYTDLVERHDAFCGAFKDADQEIREKALKELMRNGKGGVLYERAKASKDTLDFRYYWAVWERFRKAQMRFAWRLKWALSAPEVEDREKRFAWVMTRGGKPQPKHRLERVLFPMEFGNFSEPVDWIHSDVTNRVYIRRELEEVDEWRRLAHHVFDPLWNSGQPDAMSRDAAYAWLAEAMSLPPEQAHISQFDIEQCKRLIDLAAAKRRIEVKDNLRRGHFVIHTPSGEIPIHFEIVMDRPLPDGALIKGIALSGYFERPFVWKWSLIFSLQIPPHPKAPDAKRIAGIDFGWRDMGDYIRVGVLADSAGDCWELRLYYDQTRNKDRKFIERLTKQGVTDRPMPRDIRLIAEMQRQLDERLEACKIDIAGVDRTAWPEEARAMMSGIVKMRAGGLRRLRRALFKAGISYEFLDDWRYWWERHLRRYRAAQIAWIARRNETYRLFARWIADNYGVVGWEGDLNLKALAEKPGKRKQARKKKHEQTGEWEHRTVDERTHEASQKRRQWASLHILRTYIREAMVKQVRNLQDHPAAYSTQTCDECGLRIAPGAELKLSCEARHEQDQDINAARRYLTAAQEGRREVTGESASVDRSQLLRVVRLVSSIDAK